MRREYTLKDGVKEAWEYFIAHQFTIIIITARGKKYDKDNEAYTKSFLQDHGLVYDKIYFHQKKKVKKALREHVEIFIDDKEWILDEMNKYGIKSLCMGKSSKYPSFDNWYQVLDYIKEEYHGR